MQHKKTIIYTGNFSIEKMNAAGKRVFANALILQDIGYHLVLVGVDSSDNNSKDILDTKSVIKGVEIFHYPSSLYLRERLNFIAFYKEFVKLLCEMNWDIKAIIGYNSPSISLFIGKLLRYCKKNGIKYISDVADWLIVDSYNPLYRALRQLDINVKNSYYIKKSDGVIAISSWLAKYYEKNIKNIIIIPPLAIEKMEFNANQEEVPQIVYAGIPFRPNKMVRNLSSMKDRFDIVCKLLLFAKEEGVSFSFHVYGFTKEEILYCVPALEQTIYMLNDNLFFHGMTPMKEVQDAVSKADYTILIRERNRMTSAGFPTKVSESISCGTPVITTKTSDIELYLQEEKEVFYIDLSNECYSREKINNLLLRKSEDRKKQKEICLKNDSFKMSSYYHIMKKFLADLQI